METEILKGKITPFSSFSCAPQLSTCSQSIISINLSVISVTCQVGASSERLREKLTPLSLFLKEEATTKKVSFHTLFKARCTAAALTNTLSLFKII